MSSSFGTPGNRNISNPIPPRPARPDVDDEMSDQEVTTQSSTTTVTASQHTFQQTVNDKVLGDLIARMSRCHSLPELLKTIPAPAQEATKAILERATDAFTRSNTTEATITSWQDALNKGEFDKVHELNSIKPPNVQTSKLAQEVDNLALTALTFTSAITVAKKAALQNMIAIKEQESINLKTLYNDRSVRLKIYATWKDIAARPGITPEHITILLHKGCAERLVQMAVSIGRNSLTRLSNIKTKREEKKAETEKDRTNVAEDPKTFQAMFREMMKREQQSVKDKKISKKGSGRAGPPKTSKNPIKNRATKVQKKGPKQSAKKVGPSTKGRQKKR
jgi:hypothetical protein